MVRLELIKGDCLEVLKTFETDSIDLIASDPPYQLSQPNTKTADKFFE